MKECSLCGRTGVTLEEFKARCLYKMTWGPSETSDNSKTQVFTNVTDWNIVLCQSCKNKAYRDYLTKEWKGNWGDVLLGTIIAVIAGLCGFFLLKEPGPEVPYDKWVRSAILIIGFAAGMGCIACTVATIYCLVNALWIPLLRIRFARSNKVPTKFTKKVFLHIAESIKGDLIKKKVTGIHGNYTLPSTGINGAESRIRSLNLQKEEWIVKLVDAHAYEDRLRKSFFEGIIMSKAMTIVNMCICIVGVLNSLLLCSRLLLGVLGIVYFAIFSGCFGVFAEGGLIECKGVLPQKTIDDWKHKRAFWLIVCWSTLIISLTIWLLSLIYLTDVSQWSR